jgi:hypothetical protein
MAAQTKKDQENDDFKRVSNKEPLETEEEKLERERDEKISLWNRYDRTFLVTYSIQSFNGGLKFLFMLSYQDLYKNFYKLQPTHT